MAEFVMPALGADMSAGTLVAWRKQPGDVVSRGDIIAEVETDKANIEVEVWTSGVIEKLLVEPGMKVPVGTPLAVIAEEGSVEAKPAPAPAPVPAPAPGERLLVSPSAKQLAEELGVDLASVTGTGPHGRIQRKDVERAARAAAAAAAAAPAPAPASPPAREAPPPARPPAEAEDKQARMRRAIAAAMTRSKREIPHFYLAQTIDLSRAMAWLADENTRRPVAERLLHGVLFVKAVALALREHPVLNATWQGEEVVQSERINVGVAIALRGGGLVAPAIHDTDRLTLDELMRAFRELVARARAGTLRSSELFDSTITVTSLGERGVELAFPVIFPPQVAIVGFGKVVERPWVFERHVLPCPVVTATLAADHRVTDGHQAGVFLARLDELLQEPEAL